MVVGEEMLDGRRGGKETCVYLGKYRHRVHVTSSTRNENYYLVTCRLV